jgi:type II secretory pathway pseudopilin PulG
MNQSPISVRRRASGFTLMELFVVIGIILILAVITLPILNVVQHHAGKVQAVNVMRQLGSAAGSFAVQNDNMLPGEGSVANNSWNYATDPANANCWINALPRLLGMKGAGDFAANPAAFYTKENLLFLPGAEYPVGNVKLVKPLFAIGINSKLQRKVVADGPGSGKIKGPVRLNNITNPSRTVLFLERGLPSEKRALMTIPPYDGAPKASFNAFVARYSGFGMLTFVDGHAESVAPTDILLPLGNVPFPPTDVIWCKTPEENPN